MRIYKNAIFMTGPNECVIGVREGRGYWFISKLPEKYSDGYGFTGDKDKALKMSVDVAKALMADECVKRYNVFE